MLLLEFPNNNYIYFLYYVEKKLDLLVKLTLNKFNFFDYIEMKKKYQMDNDLINNSEYEY